MPDPCFCVKKENEEQERGLMQIKHWSPVKQAGSPSDVPRNCCIPREPAGFGRCCGGSAEPVHSYEP